MFLSLNIDVKRQDNREEERKSLWQFTSYVVINSSNIRRFLVLIMYFDTHPTLFVFLPKDRSGFCYDLSVWLLTLIWCRVFLLSWTYHVCTNIWNFGLKWILITRLRKTYTRLLRIPQVFFPIPNRYLAFQKIPLPFGRKPTRISKNNCLKRLFVSPLWGPLNPVRAHSSIPFSRANI